MIDLKAIAKDAAERVHKNGGCVPQMAFAPILFALEDALSTTPTRAEAQDEGAAGERKAEAWSDFESDHLTDGKGQASVEVYRRCRDAFETAWPKGAKEAYAAALAAFHPSPTPAADVQKLEAERDAWKLRGDNHWETLRSIREFAREGDCERIIKWVNDAGSGYTESAEQTLGQMTDRALKAEVALASTPADDADRVRIAVEALEKISNRRSIVFGRGEMSGQEAFGIATEALAALKSEGK